MSMFEREKYNRKEIGVEEVPTPIYYEMILKLIDGGETVDNARAIVNDARWYFGLSKSCWDDDYIYRTINEYAIAF